MLERGREDAKQGKAMKPTYRHGQQSFGVVLQREVFVREALGAIYAHRARPVAVQKVAALAHELGYL